MSWESWDQAALNAAGRDHADFFYGMKGRNAMGKQLVFIAPFMQASLNPIRVYSKILAEKPLALRQPLRAYDRGKREESGIIYDVFGIRPVSAAGEPEALIFSGNFGENTIRIPFIGNILTPLSDTSYMDFKLSDFNPVTFGQNNLGLGPVPQQALSLSQEVDAVAARTPELVKDAVNEYRGGEDVNFLMGMAPDLVKRATMPDGYILKQKAPAAGALMAANPEEYGEFDEMGNLIGFSDAGAAALSADADSLAMGLMVQEGATKSAVRGMARTAPLTTDATGQEVSSSLVKEEFYKTLEDTGSYSQAVLYTLSKYGKHNVMYLVGAKESMDVGTEDLYRFTRGNMDKMEKYRSVIGYVDPALDFAAQSVDMKKLQKSWDQGDIKTVKEMTTQANRILSNFAKSELKQKFIDGYYTEAEYEAQLSNFGDSVKAIDRGSFDYTKQAREIELMQEMASDPELVSEFPAVGAMQIYLTERQRIVDARVDSDHKTLGTKRNLDVTQSLLGLGDELVKAYPEFGPAWYGTLRSEVEYDG